MTETAQKIGKVDCCDGPLAAAQARRFASKALLDHYAQMVYDAHDENR